MGPLDGEPHVYTGLFPQLVMGFLDGDLHVYTGLDADGCDLLHHISGGVQVDKPLVDPAPVKPSRSLQLSLGPTLLDVRVSPHHRGRAGQSGAWES
jgi:hypothetical protein